VASEGADCVVVTRLDRLSRKAWRLLWLLDEKDLNVLALEQCFDTNEPEGWLSAAIHSIMSDYERRLIGKRTSQALRQLVREGKQVGVRSGIPEAVEDRIYLLHLEGLSASAIARALNEDAAVAKPGKSREWSHAHLQRAVRRAEARQGVAA
jgi:DNA invertase Pin-like site-specific DNA recombinase